MNREEIIEKLRKIYAEHFDFGFDVDDITEETDCENDLNFDSLDQCEFIMTVEREFGITISEDDGYKIGGKVGNMVAYLENVLKD